MAEQDGSVRVYRWNSNGQQWDASRASGAEVSFYNSIDEDEAASQTKWVWHIQVGSLDTEVSQQFDYETPARRFRLTDASHKSWALVFSASAALLSFVGAWEEKLFENTYKLKFSDENVEKVYGPDCLYMAGKTESQDSQLRWAADSDPEAPTAAEDLNKARKRHEHAVAKRPRITSIALGAGNRSFLLRDGQMDVLINAPGTLKDTSLSFRIQPDDLTYSHVKALESDEPHLAGRMMLMDCERTMNVLSPGRATHLKHVDLDTGAVVTEWAFKHEDHEVEIKDVCNNTAHGQLESASTFLGIGNNRLARWDKRVPKGQQVQSMSLAPTVSWVEGKDYGRGTNFTCLATSGDGYVVVGSKDGQIRMYNEGTLTRAQTRLPSLGAPIKAVDVTFDSKWVLATTDNFLVVICRTFRDETGAASSGFRKSINCQGAHAAKPRLLRLKAEDAAKLHGAPLRSAKFSWVTRPGHIESWIVASCGSHSVIWNFRRVKTTSSDIASLSGMTVCTDYHLLQKSDPVLDSLFMHEHHTKPGQQGDAAIIVATRDRVWASAQEDEKKGKGGVTLEARAGMGDRSWSGDLPAGSSFMRGS